MKILLGNDLTGGYLHGSIVEAAFNPEAWIKR